MSYHKQSHFARAASDPGDRVAQLRHVLRLVEGLAGRSQPQEAGDAELDAAARISSAYWQALPVVQRRFDAMASETAAWSVGAVEALLAAGDGRSPAAARRLADELQTALNALKMLLRR